MMKTSIIIALPVLLLGCMSIAGNMRPEDTIVSETIDAPGQSMEALFVASNAWLVDQFMRADAVVEYSDKAAGVIKGKCVQTSMSGGTGITIRSTLTLEVKDGKARITLGSPHIKTLDGTFTEAVTNRDTYDRYCVSAYMSLIDSYRKALAKPATW